MEVKIIELMPDDAIKLSDVAIACELYKLGEISLDKAREIASVDIEEMKEILHKKGIVRKSGLKLKETKVMAKKAIKFAKKERP